MIIFVVFVLALATLLFLLFLLGQQVKFIVFVLELVSPIVDLITLPIYSLIDQPWCIRLHSKTVCAERHYEPNGDYYWQTTKNADSEMKKLSKENQRLKRSLGKLKHLSELWTVFESVHKEKRCFGRRKILSRKLEDGEVKFELSGDYEWTSFGEVLRTVREFAKILQFKFQLKHRDRVAVFAETSPEFFIMFAGLQSLGCEMVLLRSTPNEVIIPYVLNENEIDLVLTQTNFVKLLNKLKPAIRTVRRLVCFRHPFANDLDDEELLNAKYELFEYEQLIKEA